MAVLDRVQGINALALGDAHTVCVVSIGVTRVLSLYCCRVNDPSAVPCVTLYSYTPVREDELGFEAGQQLVGTSDLIQSSA